MTGAPLACPQCGVTAGSDDRFCTQCGFDLMGQPEPAATGNSDPEIVTSANQGDDRTWAALTHLSAFLVFTPVPFGNIVGPLAIWLFKRSNSPLIDQHGREALNFQISTAIYFFIVGAFTVMAIIPSLFIVGIPFLLLGIFLLGVLCIFWVVMVIIAAIRAGNGHEPGYLLAIRFLK